jgi:hypothetical protein
MNHLTIKEKEIIERYILRQLTADEEKLFEEHFIECEKCFNELRATEKIILGLKNASAKGLLKTTELKGNKFFNLNNLLNVLSPPPSLAIATTVLLVILIYPAWQGIFNVPKLEKELANLQKPQIGTQNYFLETTRSYQDIQTIKLPLDNDNKSFLLSFNILEKSIPDPSYNAEITDQSGQVIWKTEDLKGVGDYEVFTIICHNAFFNYGNYILKVYEINTEENKILSEFIFSFRIVGQN